MTLTLNCQGQIWNLLHLSQKYSARHETKGKHIDWTKCLKCDHHVLSWPWPWPWMFKVKYGICYISTKSGPMASKQEANMSIELQASNVTNGFDNELDLWISRSNVTLTFDHTHGLDHGLLYLRMRGSIDIEQRGWEKVIHDHDHLVTKVRCKDLRDSDQVASDVGVPSTRLVFIHFCIFQMHFWSRRCQNGQE